MPKAVAANLEPGDLFVPLPEEAGGTSQLYRCTGKDPEGYVLGAILTDPAGSGHGFPAQAIVVIAPEQARRILDALAPTP